MDKSTAVLDAGSGCSSPTAVVQQSSKIPVDIALVEEVCDAVTEVLVARLEEFGTDVAAAVHGQLRRRLLQSPYIPVTVERSSPPLVLEPVSPTIRAVEFSSVRSEGSTARSSPDSSPRRCVSRRAVTLPGSRFEAFAADIATASSPSSCSNAAKPGPWSNASAAPKQDVAVGREVPCAKPGMVASLHSTSSEAWLKTGMQSTKEMPGNAEYINVGVENKQNEMLTDTPQAWSKTVVQAPEVPGRVSGSSKSMVHFPSNDRLCDVPHQSADSSGDSSGSQASGRRGSRYDEGSSDGESGVLRSEQADDDLLTLTRLRSRASTSTKKSGSFFGAAALTAAASFGRSFRSIVPSTSDTSPDLDGKQPVGADEIMSLPSTPRMSGPSIPRRDSSRSAVSKCKSIGSDSLILGKFKHIARKTSVNRLLDDRPKPGDQSRCPCAKKIENVVKRMVCSQLFDWFVCFFIVVNAVTLGIQTDLTAGDPTASLPQSLRVMELIFCFIFTLELLFRLIAFGSRFFTGVGWQWNLFDFLVVGLQIVEEALLVADLDSQGIPMNASTARMLRILRLIRVIRLVRILRLIRELRMLVQSIVGSLKSLGWTILLMVLMVYTVSLYITSMVTEHRSENQLSDQIVDCEGEIHPLTRYFGTLPRTMLSLFQAITGGVDWDTLVHPLFELPFLVPMVFALFIAFAILAMMNVVTGVFVDSVLISAKADKDMFLLHAVRDIFKGPNGETMSFLEWSDFESRLQSRAMMEFFKGIDVDPSEAKGLFQLLDLDDSGGVDAEEFFTGCLRLRGPAKALDTALVVRDLRNIARRVQKTDAQLARLITQTGVRNSDRSNTQTRAKMTRTPTLESIHTVSTSRASKGRPEKRMSRDVS